MSNLKCVFKEQDFNSSDGMLTYVWGPSLWHFLHTMSFNYPVKPTKKQKTDYHNFISNLQNILPCGHCRNNLSKNLINAKLTKTVFNNRENFSKFIYRLHNTVNQMLGKKKSDPTSLKEALLFLKKLNEN